MHQSNYKQPTHSGETENFNRKQRFALVQRMIQRKLYALPSVKQHLRWSSRQRRCQHNVPLWPTKGVHYRE